MDEIKMQVILVGHSAGGINVTDALHKFPEKIQAAVYIAATMLKLGFHSDQDLKDVSFIILLLIFVTFSSPSIPLFSPKSCLKRFFL